VLTEQTTEQHTLGKEPIAGIVEDLREVLLLSLDVAGRIVGDLRHGSHRHNRAAQPEDWLDPAGQRFPPRAIGSDSFRANSVRGEPVAPS
jgi:hypothetical protein